MHSDRAVILAAAPTVCAIIGKTQHSRDLEPGMRLALPIAGRAGRDTRIYASPPGEPLILAADSAHHAPALVASRSGRIAPTPAQEQSLDH